MKNKIKLIIVGKNNLWKQESKFGKKNNQNFQSIPFNRFIEMIKYKSEEVGIELQLVEESYTSKCSFIDNDVLPKYEEGNNTKYEFSGYRKKNEYIRKIEDRKRKIIHSDINGSYNIMRKYYNEVKYEEGIIKVIPERVNILIEKTVEDKEYTNRCRKYRIEIKKVI